MVGAELGTQSRKIVNKKYGEDYVKTFLPGEEEKKEEKTDLDEPLLKETPQ